MVKLINQQFKKCNTKIIIIIQKL